MSDLPPPPRRPAPEALRRRIQAELDRAEHRRRFGAAPMIALVAAVVMVITVVVGVSAARRPLTAEPAQTSAPSAPAPTKPTPTASATSASATPTPTASGPANLSLDVRAMSAGEIRSTRKACYAQRPEEDLPSAEARPVYAQWQRWAGLQGPGWNQSRVLISRAPDVGIWTCEGDVPESDVDNMDELSTRVPVFQQQGYGTSTGLCTHSSGDTATKEALFQVLDTVVTARVRLVHDGQVGPWQTTTRTGGYAHFSIGLVGEEAWATSVTAEYEFFDAAGKRLQAVAERTNTIDKIKTTTRVVNAVATCADMTARTPGATTHKPPDTDEDGIKTCTSLQSRAGSTTGFSEKGWDTELVLGDEDSWGAVLRKDDQRFACSLAPTREVGAVVKDRQTTAKSSFYFAINPIEATEGASFWAAGRVPEDVSAITYVLPGGVSVAAEISDTGSWMAMYHVDGKDLGVEADVSDWDPVEVTITRRSGPTIHYEIPFDDETMCNQISHGC